MHEMSIIDPTDSKARESRGEATTRRKEEVCFFFTPLPFPLTLYNLQLSSKAKRFENTPTWKGTNCQVEIQAKIVFPSSITSCDLIKNSKWLPGQDGTRLFQESLWVTNLVKLESKDMIMPFVAETTLKIPT